MTSTDTCPNDRAQRLADAQRRYEEVMTTRGPEPDFAYYEAGVVGFVFGEMWARQGMTRKERRWVTLACVAAAGAVIPIQTHVYAALKSGDCSLEEVDEFGLHVATQLGWPKGQNVNMLLIQAINQVATENGHPPRRPAVTEWTPDADLTTRIDRGRVAYEEVMLTPAPEGLTTFRQIGYLAYLYGEVWTRPGLTTKERRIVSICCAAHSGSTREVEDHLRAALASRDLSYAELQELVLHYAVYLGWLQAVELDDALVRVYKRFQQANGKP